MVRVLDKADAMLTLSSALWYRKSFTIYQDTDMFTMDDRDR